MSVLKSRRCAARPNTTPRVPGCEGRHNFDIDLMGPLVLRMLGVDGSGTIKRVMVGCPYTQMRV